MTHMISVGPSQPYDEAAASLRLAAARNPAGRLLTIIARPDLLAVVAICAVGLVLTLVAAAHLASVSDALTEIYLTP